MDPKFQSSFIPKGPAATAPISASRGRKTSNMTFLGFIGLVVFIISLAAAAGVFGYTYYLKYRIDSLTSDLETARQALQYDAIEEIIRLDGRIVSARTLIGNHVIISPVFEFLETSTVKNVRFTDLLYSSGEGGLVLTLVGEARGYGALALQADIFGQSEYLKDVSFSDISLNEQGDVAFKVTASIDPRTVSYSEEIRRLFPSASESPAAQTTPEPVLTEPVLPADAATSSSATTTTPFATSTSPGSQ